MRWLVLASSLVASTALAQDAQTLAWSAPEGCIQAAPLALELRRALGRPLDPRVTLEGHVEGTPSHWRVDLAARSSSDAPRVRHLESHEASCASLSDAIIVVAALLVDETEQTIVAPAVAPEPTALVPAPIAEPEEAETPPPPAEHWSSWSRLAAAARVDELPGLAGQGALEIELVPPVGPAWMLSIAGAPGVDALDASGRGGHFQDATVSLGVCPSSDPAQGWALGGCGLVTGSYLLADGRGVMDPRHAEGFTFGVAGDAFGRVRIAGPLWVRASIGLVVPFVRARASIDLDDGQHLVHEVAPVVPQGSLGIELSIP